MLIDKELLLDTMESLENDPRELFPQWREAVDLVEMQRPAIRRLNKVMENALDNLQESEDFKLGFMKAWMLALLVVKGQ